MHFFIKKLSYFFPYIQKKSLFLHRNSEETPTGVMNDMNASVYKLIIKPLNLKQND